MEVRVSAQEPAAWSLCTARVLKPPFAYVVEASSAQARLVRLDDLRPCTKELTLDKLEVRREALRVEEPVAYWLLSADGRCLLADVREKTGLLNCFARSILVGVSIIMVGSTQQIDLARHLLQDVHLKHQAEVLRLSAEIQRVQAQAAAAAAAAARHKRPQGLHPNEVAEDFQVDRDFVGRLIGKQGTNIRQAEEKCRVKVDVQQPQDSSSTSQTVRITGSSLEAVQAARRSIEIVRVDVAVPEDFIGWLLGKKGQYLREVAQKAHLASASFDRDHSVVALAGTRDNIESAKLLLAARAAYLPVFQDMSEEARVLRECFEDLEAVAAERRAEKEAARRASSGGRGRAASAGRARSESRTSVRSITPPPGLGHLRASRQRSEPRTRPRPASADGPEGRLPEGSCGQQRELAKAGRSISATRAGAHIEGGPPGGARRGAGGEGVQHPSGHPAAPGQKQKAGSANKVVRQLQESWDPLVSPP